MINRFFPDPVCVLRSAVSFNPQSKMQVFELESDDSCLRCKHHSFLPVCSEERICKKCKKSRIFFHARWSAERKRERVCNLKQETDALRIEFAKAVSELKLVEAANQVYILEVENKKQQYEEFANNLYVN